MPADHPLRRSHLDRLRVFSFFFTVLLGFSLSAFYSSALHAEDARHENKPEKHQSQEAGTRYDQLWSQADRYMGSGRYEDAIQAFQQCAELVQNDPKRLVAVYDNVALAYTLSNDNDAAVEYYKKAIAL